MEAYDSTFDIRLAAYDAGIPVVSADTPVEMIWTDIETTGLSPSEHVMLEVAFVCTTSYGAVIDGRFFHRLIDQGNTEDLRNATDKDFVVRMHDKSGLWDALHVAESRENTITSYSPSEVEDQFLEWVGDLELPHAAYPLSGSTVHFDRSFIADEMPAINEWFHYRNIDVSTLKNIAMMINKPVFESAPKKDERHRSIPDIFDSIREYRHYLDNLIIEA